MVYGVGGRPVETMDYLDVVSRQLDRIASAATRYFEANARGRSVADAARALVGAVLVLHVMTIPVLEGMVERRRGLIGREAIRALRENEAELRKVLTGDASPAYTVALALDALQELIRALDAADLLIRRVSDIARA